MAVGRIDAPGPAQYGTCIAQRATTVTRAYGDSYFPLTGNRVL